MNQAYDCSHSVDIADEPRHRCVLGNAFIRAFWVEIPRQTRTLCHQHAYDYLVYVGCGAEIITAALGREPKKVRYSDGECELAPAGLIHVVENLGDMPFRNVLVELKPSVAELQRGERPSRIVSRGSKLRPANPITQLLSNSRAAVFEIQCPCDADISVPGPALVASPYGDSVVLRYFDGKGDEILVRNERLGVGKLAWIDAAHRAVLRGGAFQGMTSRAVVFQIGTIDARAAVPQEHRPLKVLRTRADDNS